MLLRDGKEHISSILIKSLFSLVNSVKIPLFIGEQAVLALSDLKKNIVAKIKKKTYESPRNQLIL